MGWGNNSTAALAMGFGALAFAGSAGLRTTTVHDGCAGSSSGRELCPGIDPYQLVVQSDGLRENLWVRSSAGDVNLNFAKTVNPAPSRILDPVEWRTDSSGQPTAMIVQLTTDSDPGQNTNGPSSAPVDPSPGTSYSTLTYVVVKLDPQASCVVQNVDGTKDKSAGLSQAHKFAEQAQSMNCIVIPAPPVQN